MTRYYFDLSNGSGFVRDLEGQLEESLLAATQAAIEGLRSVISGEINEGKAVSRSSFVSIRCEDSDEVTKVYFDDAVTILE
ncbi:DUF6894 family protein [Allopontixanthobacter sediminis]|uniref:DUF6894 domain-containing protein n=1 Tax=Allopontixanthobacter sediminis TaxID=1689985 RepID=A0A845B5F4_9SPHN|nr:hypothetical protein [Allopontixanthobacter sediminis]MXP45386.1 hypothetical protein [Allopontixanthobacter sediminis]